MTVLTKIRPKEPLKTFFTVKNDYNFKNEKGEYQQEGRFNFGVQTLSIPNLLWSCIRETSNWNELSYQERIDKVKDKIKSYTPLMQKLDGLIKRAPHDMLIVSKSKQIVNVIKERHPHIGIWTGDIKEGLDRKVVVATNQVLGVGVDGLQHKYQTIVVLDPVEEGSGEYDDYRQLLWRITGSRQQHDVNVIEFYYKGE